MLKHLFIVSILFNFIGCDGELDKSTESPATKPALTKNKPSSLTETNKPLLDLEIKSDMMEAITGTDKNASKSVSEKPGLFDNKSIKKQDTFNTSFGVYFDENETDYLNPEAIEGGKIEIELVH